MRDMCIKLPQNLKSFLEVNGVGQTKANRYGERFIKLIRAYRQKISKHRGNKKPLQFLL
ncbi:MAG: HRDC domain-containing protein [Eubacteriales bacterium]